jgi:hypothetical protein
LVFSGVGVEQATWEYIFHFLKRRLMKSPDEQAKNDRYFSRENLNELSWPRHADGSCDYVDAGGGASD